MTNNIQPAP